MSYQLVPRDGCPEFVLGASYGTRKRELAEGYLLVVRGKVGIALAIPP